jgi:hypothetical protein
MERNYLRSAATLSDPTSRLIEPCRSLPVQFDSLGSVARTAEQAGFSALWSHRAFPV